MAAVVEFRDVASHLKSVFPQRGKEIETTNAIFRIFTKFTPTILLLTAGLIFFQRLTEDHINCHTSQDEDENVRSSAVNQYCFITGTYTIASYPPSTGKPGRSLPYPGVGPYIPPSSRGSGSQVKYHLYYQWVPFVLAIQAIFFLLPNLVWNLLEKKKLESYCGDALRKSFIVSHNQAQTEQNEEESSKDFFQITPDDYFIRNLKHHKIFSFGFAFCETLNFIFLILSIALADALLAGDFGSLGTDWMSYISTPRNETLMAPSLRRYTDLDQISPFDRIFPKMSKCEFKRFGPGGGIINHDILCVMTLNVIHEKVFLLFWFWFFLLMPIQALVLVYRLLLLCLRSLRCRLILRKLEQAFFRYEGKDLDTEGKQKEFYLFSKKAKRYVGKLEYSDWFMLRRIASNMDRGHATRFLQNVVERLYKLDFEHRNNFNNELSDADGNPVSNFQRQRNMSHGSLYANLNRSLVQIQEEEGLVGNTDEPSNSRGTRNRQRQQHNVDMPDGMSTNGDAS
ncbi:unnamed protein product [Orchesella dallaii]|uniref:Innexin n=1 Tax=Orchesella dallaii TaxID=48710 RepID=A0ABP1R2Z9_9HEXA